MSFSWLRDRENSRTRASQRERHTHTQRKSFCAPAAFLHPTQDMQGHFNSHTAAKHHWVTRWSEYTKTTLSLQLLWQQVNKKGWYLSARPLQSCINCTGFLYATVYIYFYIRTQLNVSQQFPWARLLSCNSCQKQRKIAAGAELSHKKTDVS